MTMPDNKSSTGELPMTSDEEPKRAVFVRRPTYHGRLSPSGRSQSGFASWATARPLGAWPRGNISRWRPWSRSRCSSSYCTACGNANLRVPMAYDGDGVVFQTWCKALVDHGWYLHIPNLGTLLTHGRVIGRLPRTAETCNFLIIKFFALFTSDAQLVVNLFTLSTYVLTTVTALLVLRHFHIAYPPALACSLLYSFLPYHFKRASCHHLLACYQIVPLSIMLALWVYSGRLPWSAKQDSAAETVEGPPVRVRWLWAMVICVLQASSGVYYAFFAAYFLTIAGLAASVRAAAIQPLLASAVLMSLTSGVLLATFAPTFIYWREHGKNDIAQRDPAEAELYGFKLTSLLLPIPGHRIAKAAEVRANYDQITLNRNENTWSAQGILANIGFVVLLGLLLHRKPIPRLLEGLSVLTIFGVLFGTMGGLGMLFNLLVTPQIRSQNRISIFLSFCCLACLAFLLQLGWARWATSRKRKLLLTGMPWPAWSCLVSGISSRASTDRITPV